jgi:glutamate synthase domain-containing protein 2
MTNPQEIEEKVSWLRTVTSGVPIGAKIGCGNIEKDCEQYRICHTGLCPTGVTTHNPALVKQLDVEEGITKLSNFITTATQEIANLTRIVGKDDVNKFDSDDFVSMNNDLAVITGTRWFSGE